MYPDANTLTAFVELRSIGLQFVYHSGHCWSARRCQEGHEKTLALEDQIFSARFNHVDFSISAILIYTDLAMLLFRSDTNGAASNSAAHLACMLRALGRGSNFVCVNSITSTRLLPHMKKEILPLEIGCSKATIHLYLYVMASYSWAGGLESFFHCTSKGILQIASSQITEMSSSNPK